MTIKRIAILSMLLFLFALTLTAVHGAETPVLAPMNNYQAYVISVQAAHQSVSDKCESKTGALKAMAAKCTSDICLALFADKVSAACDGGQGGSQVAVAQPPTPDKPWYTELKDTVLDIARVGLPFVDRAMASRERRDQTASSERTAIAQYGMFKDINGQTASLGTAGFGALERTSTAGYTALTTTSVAGFNSLERLGTSGFGAIERTASSGFGSMAAAFAAPKLPTYEINVTGSTDVAMFGATITKTDIRCTSGNGGNGGNGAPGGNSGTSGTTPPTATPPATTPPAATGQAGTTGAGGQSTAGPGGASGPCTIQK